MAVAGPAARGFFVTVTGALSHLAHLTRCVGTRPGLSVEVNPSNFFLGALPVLFAAFCPRRVAIATAYSGREASSDQRKALRCWRSKTQHVKISCAPCRFI